MDESQNISTFGGPLFRLPNTSHTDFSTSWYQHGQLATPWFLNFGIWEYIQIHLPDPTNSSSYGSAPSSTKNGINLSAAKNILLQADGVAVVRCIPMETADGVLRPFGDSGKHPFFAEVVARDERRFLHVESGATAVKGNPPVFDVPKLTADEWRTLALEIGGVEHVFVQEGKSIAEGLRWDEWERYDGKRTAE
jgi:hypothetical protein